MYKFKYLLQLILCCAICACTGSITSNAPFDATKQSASVETEKTWQLVWADEFDTDLERWKVWEGGAYNKEIQMYTGRQLEVTDGLLIIKAQRESARGYTLPNDATPKDFEYVSGRIESKAEIGPSDADGEREYRYMARLKLPRGKGMWPAFWSYGDPWPTLGEIDVLEGRGSEPNWFQSNLFFGYQPGNSIIAGNYAVAEYNLDTDLTADFHTYELIWRADSLEVKLDGNTLHHYQADDKNYVAELFGKQHRIVLNVAVGGWFIEETDSATFADHAQMQVDWVRVYKR